MIINDYYKFVYVRTMKTASATLHYILKQLPHSVTAYDIWGSLTEHQSVTEIAQHMTDTHRDIADYFTFTVVRNPWDWLNSMYYHDQYMIDIWNKSDPSDITHRMSHSVFTDWISEHPDRVTYSDTQHYLTPWRDFSEFYWANPDLGTYNTEIYLGGCDIDFYIKYEDLYSDIKRMCDHIHLPSQVFSDIKKIRLNSLSRPQSEYQTFTPEILSDIPQRFMTEINLHNYEPPQHYA